MRRVLTVLSTAALLVLGLAGTAVAAPGDVTITAPADGSGGADATPLVQGTADPSLPVHVLVNGSEVGTTMPAVDGTWSWQLTSDLPTEQSAVITATVLDGGGNPLGSTSVTYFVWPAPGTVTVVAPHSGDTIAAMWDVTATITGSVQNAQLLVDGQASGTFQGQTSDTSYAFTTDTLTAGPHAISVVVQDGFGREITSAPVQVIVDDTPPPPATIESPTDGSTITDRTPTFSGSAQPGAPVVVRFDQSYEEICETTADTNGRWHCQPAGQGAQDFASYVGKRQTLRILVTTSDAVGNQSASRPISVTVDYRPVAKPPMRQPAPRPAPRPTPRPTAPKAIHGPATQAASGVPQLARTGVSSVPAMSLALLLIGLGLSLTAASRRLGARRS